MRKIIWVGILSPLAVLCFMNSACGGYSGWPGKSTSGTDAKITQEVSVQSADPLESGLWTYYASYDKTGTKNQIKSCSTYRDGTAPFGVFTSDGNLQQHFNDHVGVLVASAYDTNNNGTILFGEDYAIQDGFCPANFGTGDPDASDGFSAYCDKGHWEVLVASSFTEETKQTQPGSKFSNVNPPTDFGPIQVGAVLASSAPTPDGAGAAITVSSLSVNGASHSLSSPVTISAFGMGRAIAVDATQPGFKEAASWLADQFQSMPNGATSVTVGVNGGAASLNFSVATGPIAAQALRAFASR